MGIFPTIFGGGRGPGATPVTGLSDIAASTAHSGPTSTALISSVPARVPRPNAGRRQVFGGLVVPGRGSISNNRFDAELDAWVTQAPDTERAARETAAAAIRHARDNEEWKLTLTHLTSLPPCMANLKVVQRLTLTECNIEALPYLPPKLFRLTAEKIHLRELPAVPSSLTTLEIAFNELRMLPRLPAKLERLDAQDNQLIRLTPDGQRLPAALRHVTVNNNLLSSLPPLPSNLESLKADGNLLTSLPPLPQNLYLLSVRQNALRALPEVLPRYLSRLYVSSNQITDLSNRLATNHMLHMVDLQDNPVPNEALERIDRQLHERGIGSMQMRATRPGQSVAIDALDPSIWVFVVTIATANAWSYRRGFTLLPPGAHDGSTRPDARPSLPEALHSWFAQYDQEPTYLAERAIRWASIEASVATPATRQAAAAFPLFLTRMSETEEYRASEGRELLVMRITSLLDQIAADPQLRVQVYAIAADALRSCADRIALGLDEMELCALSAAARVGNWTPGRLAATGIGFFKLATLTQICRDKVTARPKLDDVELILAYRTTLAERLNLPVSTRKMRYFPANIVDRTDRRAVYRQVEECTKDHDRLARYLIDWAPWREYLDRSPMAGQTTAMADIERVQATLYEQLAHLMETLDQHRKQGSEESTAALDIQARIACLRDEYEATEAKHLGPLRLAATLAYLDTIG